MGEHKEHKEIAMVIKEIETIQLDKNAGKRDALYQQINRHIRSKIEAGNLGYGDRLPSVTRIANTLGVEPATVNAAFNLMEKDGIIKREPGRGKGPIIVRKARQKMSLKHIRWVRDFLDLQLSEGISRYAAENDLEFIIIDVADPDEHLVGVIEHTFADGILLIPCHIPNFVSSINRLRNRNVKIVLLDHSIDGIDVDSVSIDNINGAYLATRHLLKQHGQPVFHLGLPGPSSALDRRQGWTAAMHEFGYDNTNPFLYEADASVMNHLDPAVRAQHLCQLAERMLADQKLKTYSIFATNDMVARSIYVAAANCGMTIGKDVFVVGFGNYPVCEQLPVSLTSVNQSNEQVGYEAAKLLHMKMMGATEKIVVHRKLPAKLVIRDSSGCRQSIADPNA